jgi:hypothetical protein
MRPAGGLATFCQPHAGKHQPVGFVPAYVINRLRSARRGPILGR